MQEFATLRLYCRFAQFDAENPPVSAACLFRLFGAAHIFCVFA